MIEGTTKDLGQLITVLYLSKRLFVIFGLPGDRDIYENTKRQHPNIYKVRMHLYQYHLVFHLLI